MTELRAISAPTQAGDYRRQARRIRAIHRNNPVKTQQALRGLVAGRATTTQIIERTPSKFDWTTSAILGHRTPLARLFADRVAVQLLNGILPYSTRQDLLAQAGQMGINRFEASLIIAAVQHRMQQPAFAPATKPESSFKLGIPGKIGMLVAMELIIVAVVAIALH